MCVIFAMQMKGSPNVFHRVKKIEKKVLKKLDVSGVTIILGDLKDNVGLYTGCCIFLDYSYIVKSSDEVVEALILHEYGHHLGYLRGEIHYDNISPDLCPVSVMHRSSDLEGCFYKNRDYYYNEVIEYKEKR